MSSPDKLRAFFSFVGFVDNFPVCLKFRAFVCSVWWFFVVLVDEAVPRAVTGDDGIAPNENRQGIGRRSRCRRWGVHWNGLEADSRQ